MVIKLHRLITVECNVASLVNFAVVKFVEEWAK